MPDMANHKIQLYDLLKGVLPYEPHLLRTPMRTEDLRPEQLASAAAKTARDILRRSGAPDIEITDEDAAIAESMFMDQVTNNGTSITPTRLQKPEVVMKLEALVQEYDWRVIQHADQIRMLVTNKLIGLSDHRDPKVQLKAVELLGKLADVGMFVEKQEITYKQQTNEEIEAALRQKLGLLIDGDYTEVRSPPKTIQETVVDVVDVIPLPEMPKIDIGAFIDEQS